MFLPAEHACVWRRADDPTLFFVYSLLLASEFLAMLLACPFTAKKKVVESWHVDSGLHCDGLFLSQTLCNTDSSRVPIPIEPLNEEMIESAGEAETPLLLINQLGFAAYRP